MTKRVDIIKKIEAEFDEPLPDIVMGMREQGCNWDTVAGALGITARTLRIWRREIGFAPIDRFNVVIEHRSGERIVDRIARRYGYYNFEDMYRDMRLSRNMTVAQMSKKTGICERTITKWTPPELKGMEIKTPKKVAAAKRNLAKARAIANPARLSPWFKRWNGRRGQR